MLSYVVKISVDYSRLKTNLEHTEERLKELSEELDKHDRENSCKFTELFNSRNKTNEALTELSTTIKLLVGNMDRQFENLDRKIDALSEREPK